MKFTLTIKPYIGDENTTLPVTIRGKSIDPKDYPLTTLNDVYEVEALLEKWFQRRFHITLDHDAAP